MRRIRSLLPFLSRRKLTGDVLLLFMVLTAAPSSHASEPCTAHEHAPEMAHEQGHVAQSGWVSDGEASSCPHCPAEHCEDLLPCRPLMQYAVLPPASADPVSPIGIGGFETPHHARFDAARIPPLPPPRPPHLESTLRS